MKWDPVSIVDQLALVQGSNVNTIYQGLEIAKPNRFRKLQEQRISQRGHLRLGYWRRGGSSQLWHGIAIEPTVTG